MAPADLLNLAGLGLGMLGLGVTTWDLWPEYQLHKARAAMARARAILEDANTMQQAALCNRGELSPTDFGRGVAITNAQFISRVVRERGLDDATFKRLSGLIDEAHRRLGNRKSGAAFIFYPDRFGVGAAPDAYQKMLDGLVPAVRRFFEAEEVLEDREAHNMTRTRPPLALGLLLIALSYVLPALSYAV